LETDWPVGFQFRPARFHMRKCKFLLARLVAKGLWSSLPITLQIAGAHDASINLCTRLAIIAIPTTTTVEALGAAVRHINANHDVKGLC
jgi:hypothetical protein